MGQKVQEFSELLIKEIRGWTVRPVTGLFYHGCRADDFGIDVRTGCIQGLKWFSKNRFYAGEYAYHFSRPQNSEPYLLEVELVHEILAIERSSNISGEAWVPFLENCFPGTFGYDLSIKFQSSLRAHLDYLGLNDVHSYSLGLGEELCILDSNRFIRVVNTLALPATVTEYKE